MSAPSTIAEGFTADEVTRALGPIDDLLAVCQSGTTHAVLSRVRAELAEAIEWRKANRAEADKAEAAYERELAGEAEAAEAVETVRACRRAFGDKWPSVLPATAWRARQHVHLLILAAEHDPVALELALTRIYGPDR